MRISRNRQRRLGRGDDVNRIFTGDPSGVWACLGFRGGTLYQRVQDEWQRFNTTGLSGGISDVFVRSADDIWLASHGLYHWDGSCLTVANGFEVNSGFDNIYQIIEGPNGLLALGAFDVYAHDGSSWRHGATLDYSQFEGNSNLRGLWSDGVVTWVVGDGVRQVLEL